MLIPVLIFSVLLDKVKNWKIVLLLHVIMLVFLVLFTWKIPVEDHVLTTNNPEPFLVTFSFAMLIISATTTFTVNKTIMAKSIASCAESRGVFLGVQQLFSSLGVIMIQEIGGHIYNMDKRNPFYLCIAGEGFVILVILALGVCKQLNI